MPVLGLFLFYFLFQQADFLNLFLYADRAETTVFF